MPVNPLVAAIAAFGQGEEKGRELKRRGERDFQADVQAQRQAERQSMLDKAQQAFQQFQMQAPERAEQQRVKVQGEQDTRNASRQQAAHSMIAQRFGPQESGGEFRPDFDYAAHYDNLLANLRAQEQAKAAAERAGMSEDRRDERQLRGLSAIADRQSAGATRAVQTAQEKRREALTDNDDAMNDVASAIAEVEANPKSLGVKNYAPKIIRENLPGRDAGKDALTLGALEWFVGGLRHKRFGAALTGGEIVRAQRIFSDPTSKASVVLAQLKYIQDRLATHRKNLESSAGDAASGTVPGSGKSGDGGSDIDRAFAALGSGATDEAVRAWVKANARP